MKDIIIGIDAGTSVIKSIAFSLTGEQLAESAVSNTYVNLADGGVEQDPLRTWLDTVKTLKDLQQNIPDLPDRLAAISVTGQGDGTWLIDKHGQPVGAGWLWLELAQSAVAFHCKDWLYFNLTGERVTDPSEGCFTFGNFRTREYAEEILDMLELRDCAHLLPPMLDGVRTHHKLSAESASLLGLLQGTPVVLAYVDVLCTAWLHYCRFYRYSYESCRWC